MSENDRAARCPYGPRHKPGDAGHCRWCHQPIPEPWYMRPRPDPDELVAQIAAKHRVDIAPHVAREIAEALLGYADTAMEVRQTFLREAWSDDQYRQHLRERMRSALLDEVTKHGRIPTALPSEAIRYLDAPTFFGGQDQEGQEVPAEMVEKGAPYEMVQLVVAVQVRTPPVDRAAAVRAGVL